MNKTSMEQYKQFQDYTNYIDTSDVMLGFYKDQVGTGLQKYYLMIQEWLNMVPNTVQDNKPLVIQAQGGVGKKTLLVKWFQYHQQLLKARSKNDLIILHFATTGGNNSNYFYAIYRILIKLRQELNIGQKVQLHEEKLRNYFSYWLDVCNQKIQRQVIQNVQKIFDKIILVFEGIDYFVDRGTNKEGNIAFWLPKYFPKNVKVIVTADRQSQTMKYFNKLSCPKVNIPVDMQIIKSMIKSQTEKKLCVEGPIMEKLIKILEHNLKQVQVTSLYAKTYLSCLLPQKLSQLSLTPISLQFIQKNVQKVDTEKLSQIKDVEDLFDYILHFWSEIIFHNEDKFKELVGLLISTQKGLTRHEIIAITKVDSEELKQFITIFRAFLMNFKDLWMIKNDSFKKAIYKKYQFSQQQINQKIAQALKKTPNSVRKLQQETYQLYSAGNYFKLKEVISDIQNFLLLFNPYTKYDLCRYWQKLQERSFDPVIEYNKAIEGFQMHYHPNSDDLFRIITQISRFLKQFADFETYYTPEFRHPKIIGNVNELQDIGILGELKNLELCQYEQEGSGKDKLKSQVQSHEQHNDNDEEKKYKKKLKEMYEKIEEGKHIKKMTKVQVESSKQISKSKGGKDNQKKEKPAKQVRVQQLNVEVKSNENYFRQHYYKQIKPFLEKMALQGEKETFSLDQGEGEDVQSDQESETGRQRLAHKIRTKIENKDITGKSKFQNLPDLKNLYAKTVEEEFQLKQKPPTNYYYKRWIWMQFPWVCMTMKSDYSDKLRKSFTSPTSYMSVSEERQFTIQALKIALEAKKKKLSILQKTEQIPTKSTLRKTTNRSSTNLLNQISKLDRTSNQVSYIKDTKFDQSLISQKQKKAKKIQELGFVTNSFLSLHTLSKQMQSLNLSINAEGKPYDSRLSPDDSKNLFITENEASRTLNQSQSCMNLFNKKRKINKQIDQSMNLTTSKSRQGLLPRIKQSVNTSMIKQLQELQKNNAQLRKNMDTYIYKNKILAKRLKQLKIIQFNNKSQLKNQKKIQQKKQKIKEIQAKIQKVKYMYANSLLQHERQDMLIKICKRNKTNNQEKIPQLVQQCNNFKKMIKIESEAILELRMKTQQIKKLTKKFVSNYCEKIENQMQLQEEIKQTLKNRQNFMEQVQKYDKLIQEQVEEKRKQLNQQLLNSSNIGQRQNEKPDQVNIGFGGKANSSQYNMSKKWSHHNGVSGHSNGQDDQNYEEMFRQIMQYLDIENQNYQQDPKYIKLVEALNKKKQFEAVIEQRLMELQQLKKKHSELTHELETLDRAKEENSLVKNTKHQSDQENDTLGSTGLQKSEEDLQKRLHEKKRMLHKVTDVKLACLGMLNTWYARLGLPQQKNLTITNDFLERLQDVKAMNRIQVANE